MSGTRLASRALLAACALAVLTTANLPAQVAAKKPKKADSAATPQLKKIDSLKPVPPMFASDSLLALTFTANLRALRGDKGETSPWRSASMSYAAPGGATVTVPMRAKTRGKWRLKNCTFPPIRLDVPNKTATGTLFEAIEKPKFVNICKNTDRFEQHTLQEMQLYRIYNLLTPASHRVRAWRVTYRDSASGKEEATRYGFLVEDPEEMAARLGGRLMEIKGAGPDDFHPEHIALVFMFEYMIGNTDFSLSQLHNGESIRKADIFAPLITVAYDFDFSGAVNAPYATVDPQLTAIRRVRQRLFRGYCAFNAEYPVAAQRFIEKKDAIYALYADHLGTLMDPGIVRETLEYFDEFYKVIGSPREMQRNLIDNCVGRR